MVVIDTVAHYYDPELYYGHGEYEQKVWFCDNCKSSEPYIKDEED